MFIKVKEISVGDIYVHVHNDEMIFSIVIANDMIHYTVYQTVYRKLHDDWNTLETAIFEGIDFDYACDIKI